MNQVFTYVKNKDTSNLGNVNGIILYAKTNEEIVPDNDYIMSGGRISVKMLDFNCDFKSITKQLDTLVDKYFKLLKFI